MRLMLLGAVAALPVGAPSLLARGDGTFLAPLKLRNVLSAVAVAAGDFNRDGKMDLATVGGDRRITVLLQDPSFRADWKFAGPLQVGMGNFYLRAADLDADGDDDLAVADPASIAYLLISKGDGTFEPAVPMREARGARSVTSADWNGDGHLDLAWANHDSFTVSIYLGRGGGSFELLRNLRTPEEPHAIESLDYDGDGLLDLMVGVADAGLLPLKGTGEGNFQIKAVLKTLGCVEHIATGDFNRDGLVDMVTTCFDFQDAAVAINLGNGEFRKVLDDQEGLIGFIPAVADLNRDGTQDIALASPGIGTLRVHLGTGDGSFLSPTTFSLAVVNPYFLLARDLDDDGHVDVVSTDGKSPTLTVLWGRAGVPFLESSYLLSSPGALDSMSVADLDRDGVPDLCISAKDPAPRIRAHLGPGRTASSEPSVDINTRNLFSSLEAADLDEDGVPDFLGVYPSEGAVVLAFLTGKVKGELVLPAGLFPASAKAARIDRGTTLDVAAPCTRSNHVAVFLGQGGGAFQEAILIPSIEAPVEIALGDLDSDGQIDLAVMAQAAIAVHFGDSSGLFSDPVKRAGGAREKNADLAVGEVTGDSFPDLLVCESWNSSVLVFRGNGKRELEAPLSLKVDSKPTSIVLGDLDENGLLDITTANQSSASVLLNYVEQGFGPRTDYELPPGLRGHRLADLDLDGALDLIGLTPRGPVVLPGRPARNPAGHFRRGDTDGDSRIWLNDPIALLNRLFLAGPPLPCPDAADSTDDGLLDVSDPIALLNYLFLSGAPLPPPGPEACGEDPTEDSLPACSARC